MKKLPDGLTTVTRLSKIVALALFVMLPFIGFESGMRYQRGLDDVDFNRFIQKMSGRDTENVPGTSDATLLSRTYINPATKTYVNHRLGYVFDHPKGVNVYDCPGTACASITVMQNNIKLTIEPFGLFDSDSIINDDLNCLADGPSSLVRCENSSVVPYTNLKGTKGFKVSRIKTISIADDDEAQISGVYDDYVYVMPVSRRGDHGSVLISVDVPNEESLYLLEQVADSYRLE